MAKVVKHSGRSHSDLPPSSADKWLNCHAWRRLRAEFVTKYGEPPSSPAAQEGTEAHERMEKHLRGHEHLDVNYDHFDELMEAIEWVEENIRGKMFLETRIDFGSQFDYHNLTGTLDIVGVEPDLLHIADLKFGRGVVEHNRNSQGRTYLAGAVDKFGKRDAYRITILQPRAYHPEGSFRTYELTHEEFEEFLYGELEPAIVGSYSKNPKATPGPWCQNFCPMMATCRAVKDQALERFRATPILRP